MDTIHVTAHLVGTTYAQVFASDLLRYLFGAGGVYLLINLLLARRLIARKIRDRTVSGAQICREILASMRTVAIFAANGTAIVLGAQLGLMTIYDDISDHGWGYLVLTTAALIILHDAWFYWTHRLLHYPPLFRRFHRLHHRSHQPTPFTSYSFDVGEAVVNAVYLPLVLIFIPVHPLALFIFVSHMMLRNALAHCGYEVFPARKDGRPLFDWITTVTHHDMHHAHAGKNMGFYFTWWDRWMGTEHPRYIESFQRVSRRWTNRDFRIFAVVSVLFFGFIAQDARSSDIIGTYASPGLGVIVDFHACSEDPSTRCGKLVWVWDASHTPHAEPGDAIVTNLRFDGSRWVGKLKNPENGRTYKGIISAGDGEKLELRGCVGPICVKQMWWSTDFLIRVLSDAN